MIAVGDYRDVVAIQSKTPTDLGGGSSTLAYATTATVFARIRPLKGREHLQARQLVGGAVYEVALRAPLASGVTLDSKTRLLWTSPTGSRTLEVSEPPRADPRGRHFTFLAHEKE